MGGTGGPLTSEDVQVRGLRRPRIIEGTPADILLGPRQGRNRISRGQRWRDAQGDAARTAGWLGLPSMRMRVLRFGRAIGTLVSGIAGGDAGGGGGDGNGDGDVGGDELAEMMDGLDV